VPCRTVIPGYVAHRFRGMPHSDSGACRTLLGKKWGERKTLVNPKMWVCYPLEEQGGRHAPGAINREKDQRNIETEV
jgi:hypothetical protein